MSIARHHNEWLALIEQSGPFLSVPVLMSEDVFPQGLDAHDPELQRHVRAAYEEWCTDPSNLFGEWLNFVFREVLCYTDANLRSGQSLPGNAEVRIQEHGETLRADYALVNPPSDPAPGKPRLLILSYPVDQDLEKPLRGRLWKASPHTRMVELLHAADVRLGLVTNGEEWTLVNAPRGETSGFATWTADLWCEETITLRSFRSLLCPKRFFGVTDKATLEQLFTRSAANQQEVTDQLGLQVRHAVEILVSRLDRLDKDNRGALLGTVEEKRVYEAALTVMMRLVFLMCAEERGLFPMSEPMYAQHYAVTTLRDQLRQTADRHGEEVLERRHDAWVRLLALFRLIFGGSNDDRLRIAAYGGGLFDPDRFAFLEGRDTGTSWHDVPAKPLPVDNRTVLHLLEALQVLQVKVPGGGPAEARRLSFRALDIEQIGHVYEGLLDHTAVRAQPGAPVLGLTGTKDKEPEVELARLEALRAEGDEKLIEFLKEETGRSDGALWNSSTKPRSTKKTGRKKKGAPAGDLFTDDSAAGATSADPIAWPATDHETAGRFLAACGGDQALLARVLRFGGLIRSDTFGHPVVIPGGAIYVTQGTDRRSTGTHYTPRSLTEPIVQYTLEPLVYVGPAEGAPKEEWKLRPARELLDLKICDMAMGSGAFLVQACRYMSERLVESWEQEETRTGQLLTFPEADAATGRIAERPLPRDLDERLALARRAIAERCLYGVDKNPLAVEIAKLSLWLITLDRNRPFTFLDHAFKAGDSLLGLHDPKQLENFHLDPKQGDILNHDFVHGSGAAVVRKQMKKAADLRRRLESFVVNSPRDAQEKARLLREADEATSLLRTLADLVVGAQLQVFREEFDGNYDGLIQKWMTEDVFIALDEGFDRRTRAEHRASLGRHAREALVNRDTFHWALEFPEVMASGFSALVGNPPFLGGKRISTILGDEYNHCLKASFHDSKGAADLCAYFFRRAVAVLGAPATLGFIATNTIAQADTREVGLDSIASGGGTIFRASPKLVWPGQANVHASLVFICKGKWNGEFVLDQRRVSSITTSLDEGLRISRKPSQVVTFAEKASGGTGLLGIGFVVPVETANQWVADDSRYAEILFPYVNAQELSSICDDLAERFVINFGHRTEQEAESFPHAIRRVRELVKPKRDSLTRQIHEHSYWKHWDKRDELYREMEGKDRVLVCPLVTKHLPFRFLPTGWIYSKELAVFPTDRFGHFSVLQSTFHDAWARERSGTLKSDLSYSISDGFRTFAPPSSVELDGLDAIGERYHEHRRQVMLARQEGLTKTYNRFHNPKETSDDIQTLRDLHVEMDRAVLDAYRQSPGEAGIWKGFGPDDLEHGFHETKQGMRFTVSERARRELLDRLLELNHKRYAEEVAAGLHDKKKARESKKARQRGTATSSREAVSLDLFRDSFESADRDSDADSSEDSDPALEEAP